MNRYRVSAVCLLLAFCLVLAGCGGGGAAAQKLIGSWKADTSEMMKEAENAEDNPMAGMAAAIAQAFQIKMEFKKDSTMAFSVMGMNIEGKWKVVKESGNEATIEMTMKNPMSDEVKTDQTKVIFESKDRIRLKPPGDGDEELVFNREK